MISFIEDVKLRHSHWWPCTCSCTADVSNSCILKFANVIAETYAYAGSCRYACVVKKTCVQALQQLESLRQVFANSGGQLQVKLPFDSVLTSEWKFLH